MARGVHFGFVLLCTGQSNMQLSLPDVYNGSAVISDAGNHPEIRLFLVPIDHAAQGGHRNESLPVRTPLKANWTAATPQAISSFSALCYLTAYSTSPAR